jgi:hypothetical protein
MQGALFTPEQEARALGESFVYFLLKHDKRSYTYLSGGRNGYTRLKVTLDLDLSPEELDK